MYEASDVSYWTTSTPQLDEKPKAICRAIPAGMPNTAYEGLAPRQSVRGTPAVTDQSTGRGCPSQSYCRYPLTLISDVPPGLTEVENVARPPQLPACWASTQRQAWYLPARGAMKPEQVSVSIGPRIATEQLRPAASSVVRGTHVLAAPSPQTSFFPMSATRSTVLKF
jgi:hypothetical protein